ncbi:MAG: GNAT family N-acetyltransferase [Chloroflexota bacterium]
MDFIDLEHARRLELCHAMRSYHYALAQARLQPDSRAQVLHIGGGAAVYAGPESPLNRAIGLGLNGEVEDDLVVQVEAFFDDCGAQPSFDVCPLTDRSLLALLQRRSYGLVKFHNVLACRLPAPTEPGPAQIQVRPADPGDAQTWIHTTAAGFDPSGAATVEEIEMVAPNFHAANALPYLALIDGQPAGGGAMYLHEGTVELGGASTRPQYRRRGVQTALIHRRLDDAYAQGVDLAMVLTRPGSDSQRNLGRLGFRLAYSKAILVR